MTVEVKACQKELSMEDIWRAAFITVVVFNFNKSREKNTRTDYCPPNLSFYKYSY
jgi:hypothetical protein